MYSYVQTWPGPGCHEIKITTSAISVVNLPNDWLTDMMNRANNFVPVQPTPKT